jgi:hypothetical protein
VPPQSLNQHIDYCGDRLELLGLQGVFGVEFADFTDFVGTF